MVTPKRKIFNQGCDVRFPSVCYEYPVNKETEPVEEQARCCGVTEMLADSPLLLYRSHERNAATTEAAAQP